MDEYPDHQSAVETEFSQILWEIRNQGWSPEEWARNDDGDWFQTTHFVGSFEADDSYEDGEFAFSYYDESGKQWWFTFRLEDLGLLEDQGFKRVELVDPEDVDIGFLKNEVG